VIPHQTLFQHQLGYVWPTINHEKLFTQNITNSTFIFETSPNTKPKKKKVGGYGILSPPHLKKWGTRSPCAPPNCAHDWNKQYCKTDSDKDQMALSRHYSEYHGTINKPPLHEAYTVTFVEQPSCHSLDICENKWYNPIDAQINIQNMILSHVK